MTCTNREVCQTFFIRPGLHISCALLVQPCCCTAASASRALANKSTWYVFTWVHSSVARAADCRSAGPWFKSGCALMRKHARNRRERERERERRRNGGDNETTTEAYLQKHRQRQGRRQPRRIQTPTGAIGRTGRTVRQVCLVKAASQRETTLGSLSSVVRAVVL